MTMNFRAFVFLFCALCLVSSVTQGTVYKCMSDGAVSYSSRPCPEEADATVMDVPGLSPERLGGSGFVSDGRRRMEIKDALVLREVRKTTEEIRVLLYSFVLTEEDLGKIREFKGHALSARHDETKNPDPEIWDTTPIVEFQFVLKDPTQPVAMENIRHWRFVSWLNEVPTTLNNREPSLREHINDIREMRLEEGRGVRLRTASSQTFADTVYSWNVKVDAPLVTSSR